MAPTPNIGSLPGVPTVLTAETPQCAAKELPASLLGPNPHALCFSHSARVTESREMGALHTSLLTVHQWRGLYHVFKWHHGALWCLPSCLYVLFTLLSAIKSSPTFLLHSQIKSLHLGYHNILQLSLIQGESFCFGLDL